MKYMDEDQIACAMILAAGLVVLLNFKSIGSARRGELVDWKDFGILRSILAKKMDIIRNEYMTVSKDYILYNTTWVFPRNFNTSQLMRIAGFEVI
jgi:hypothetical protein